MGIKDLYFWELSLKEFDGWTVNSCPLKPVGTPFKFSGINKDGDIVGHDFYDRGRGTLMARDCAVEITKEEYDRLPSKEDACIHPTIKEAFDDGDFGCAWLLPIWVQ